MNFAAATGAGDQDFPAGISDGAGGMILVWEDFRNGAVSGYDVYAHHLLRCGTLDPTWPSGGVALTMATGDDRFPVIASDGAGGAFVAWFTGFPSTVTGDVYAQHLLADGTIHPSWPADGFGVCTASGRQALAKITADGAGGAFLTWNDNRTNPGRAFVQRLVAAGVDPAWTVNGIAVAPSALGSQLTPGICSDAAGGAIVAWHAIRPAVTSGRDIFAQRISATGALYWATNGVPVCTAPATQTLNGSSETAVWVLTSSDEQANAITPDGSGGCYVTWMDGRTLATTGHDVYAQRLTATGAVASGWPADGVALCTAPGTQNGPSILADGAGGAIATWRDFRPAPFAQHVTGAGVVDGPLDGLPLSGLGVADFVPLAIRDGSGGALLAWADGRNFATSGVDLFAHHVMTSPGFGLDPAWPVNGATVSDAPGDQILDGHGSLVSDGAGGMVLAWGDTRDLALSGFDVYAQSLTSAGTVSADPVATITGPASGSVHAVNTLVTFSGSFTDNAGDVHTAEWTFDGLPPVAGIVNELDQTVTASFAFPEAGVYSVTLTVTDGCGSSSTTNQVGGFEAMVVIYDPSAGFVTGGGWIHSPAGAYVPSPGLVGKANFGFVAKYHRGASVPTGNTEFQFRVADLNFSSTSYDWLVISGSKAQYKGNGTINGSGDYRFMLTAVDGNLQGNQPDKFRMKIIDQSNDTVVYDNQSGAGDGENPTTALGGGSIVIHRTNGMGPGVELPPGDSDRAANAFEYGLAAAQPNPFREATAIEFGLRERSRVEIDLFDVAGRHVERLVTSDLEAGPHVVRLARPELDAARRSAGVFFVRMSAHSLESSAAFSATRKLVLVD